MEQEKKACQVTHPHSGTLQKGQQVLKGSTLPDSVEGNLQEQKNGQKLVENNKYKDGTKNLLLKFNTSQENLRCFISSSKPERYRSVSTRLPKPSKSAACLPNSRFHMERKAENKITENAKSQTEKKNQILKLGQELSEESDLSRILSNQIIHHIEEKGIYCKWADIEEKKSEQILTEKSQDIQEVDQLFEHFSDRKSARRSSLQQNSSFYTSIASLNNSFVEGQSSLKNQSEEQSYPSMGNRSYSNPYDNNYGKNFSYASTIEPFSHPYYPMQMYQTQSYGQSHGLRSMPSSMFHTNEFVITLEGLGHDLRTTLMIKNIPNKYTIQYLSEEIDQDFGNYYDFLYLPCDTKSGANQGYGFINFVDLDAIKRFYERFHNKKWKRFRSEKICNLTYARLQGIESLIEHFQNSKVLNHKEKKFQPIIKSLNQIHNLIRTQQNNQQEQRQ